MFTQYQKLFKIGFIILFLLLGVYAYFATKVAINQSKEKNRFKDALFISNQKLDSNITNSGKKDYTINQLTLKKSELEVINGKLVSDLKDANIKLKNVSNVTQTTTIIRFVNDTFLVAKKVNDTLFKFMLPNNKWINLSQNIILKNNHSIVGIDSLKINIKNNLLMPQEITYKGWWIFKKAKGIKIHIISDNPYYFIDSLYSVNLIK